MGGGVLEPQGLFESFIQQKCSEPAVCPDQTPSGVPMARVRKAVLALPWREDRRLTLTGVQAADGPILLPSLHQGLLCPTRHLCSPAPAPAPKSSKKPKMKATEDMFPSDWSPPPVDFLNLRAAKANQRALARRQAGALGPPGLRTLARQPPKEAEQEPRDSDPEGNPSSLGELFWNVACTSPKAAALGMNTRTSFPSGGAECYVNSLDYLLWEKREQALEQEREELLLRDCPDLNSLNLSDDEAPLTPEYRKLVERFSTSLQVIPPVHPGEAVFLPRNQPLPCILDCSHLKPRSHLEELFLSSPPAQQLSFLRSGILSSLYLHAGECPVPLLRWLFQLLTWPPETSSGAFGLLWGLSVDGLLRQSEIRNVPRIAGSEIQSVARPPPDLFSSERKNILAYLSPDEDVRLWCPSMQEVTEAVHSLGAHDPALAPPGPFPHSGSVLKSVASPRWSEQQDTPREAALDISLSCICKFLTLCALSQPGAYTDRHLLGLMELLCRAGLDVGLRLLPKTDLQQLLLLLLENIREWPGKLRHLCCTLSRASDHHHNLLALVQLFLDVTSRSRQLRSQLSLLIIARLLGRQETLPLWQEKAQLSSLGQLLSLMRPSFLKQYLGSETLPLSREKQPKASAQLDHKVCYLCHSLLTLAGVVVSCRHIAPDQRGELQLLCMQLDRHISTHIRESPQAMHWTKLKDLATQTYIRWQELLAHCQPQAQHFSAWKAV